MTIKQQNNYYITKQMEKTEMILHRHTGTLRNINLT